MNRVFIAGAAAALLLAACSANGGTPLTPDLSRAVAPDVYQTQSAPLNWEQFAVPKPTNAPVQSDYRGIITGPDHNVWFADRQNAAVDRTAMSGAVTKFPLPYPLDLPWGMASGADGAVWFTTTGRHVGRITTAGAISEFSIPCGTYDGSLHAGSDGNMWMPDCAGNIDRITPAGVVTSFNVHAHQLKGMALGKDGNLWFSDITAHTIDRITAAGVVTAFPYHNLGANFATVLALGPDGNMWFAECNASEFGKITTTGTVSYYATPLCLTEPNSLVLGADGAMWAAHVNATGAPALERIASTGTASFVTLPSTATMSVRDVATGSDGNMWYTGGYSYRVNVYIRDVLTTSPKSISFTAVGQTAKLTIGETNYSGRWNVTSANTAIASVNVTPTPTPSPGATPAPLSYTVKALAAGHTQITVADTKGNSVKVPVAVP